MGIIALRGIEVKAYIGVSAEERNIGRTFMIDVEIPWPLKQAGISDDVQDTFNYEIIAIAVDETMKKKHKLMETACRAIATDIISKVHETGQIKITMRKMAPFIKGDVHASEIVWNYPEDF